MNRTCVDGSQLDWTSRVAKVSVAKSRSVLPAGLSLFSLAIMASTIVIQGSLFLVGAELSRATLPLGVVAAFALTAWLMRSSKRWWLGAVVVALVSVAVGALQAGAWDNNHDSLTYQVPAIIELADGANPVQSELENFWAEHHPKGAWVVSAALYTWTGEIESTRVINVLGVMSALGVALLFMRAIKGLPRWAAWVLPLLVAFNPVTLVQLDTHYVDGLLSSMSVVLILLVIGRNAPEIELEVSDRILFAIATCAAIVLANLKFTGLVLVCLIAGAHVLWGLIERGRSSAGAPERREARYAAIVCVLALAVSGVSPYLTNTVRNGHPFFPVFGANAADIADAPDARQRPDAYRDTPAPVAFLMSLSEAASVPGTETMAPPYRVKNPLWVQRSELVAMTFPDARRGGFGPLFFLGVVLALATLIWGIAQRRWTDQGLSLRTLALSLALVTVLTLLMIESWWARLAPQFYLAPVLVAAWGLSRRQSRFAPHGILSVALVVVLATNSLVIAGVQMAAHRNRRVARSAALERLAGAETLTLRFPDPTLATRYRAAIVRRLVDEGFDVSVIEYDARDVRDWRYDHTFYAEFASP